MREDAADRAAAQGQPAAPAGGRGAAGHGVLRLIETTDLHCHILPWDYFAERPAPGLGLGPAAGLAARLRAAAAASLLLDNGDFLQGNPLGDYVALERGLSPGETHPMIAAMNAAGIDAATLGNHDFDYGLDFLLAALAAARFPVVSANAVLALGAGPRQDRTLLPPWTILERPWPGRAAPLRIGIIGFLPPQVMVWNEKHLAGRLQLRDIVETARARVPELREAGAEVVVALAHTGIGAREHAPGMENAALPLARVPGIDAVLTGHSHLAFPSPLFAGREGLDVARARIEGVPAVMPGAWGSHLGVVDLALAERGGRLAVVRARAGLRPLARRGKEGAARPAAPVPAALRAVARPWHAETQAYFARPVGRTARPLQSYFALVAADPVMALVAEAQRAHAARALAGGPHAGLPILSAVSPFKAGGRGGAGFYTDVPAGPLRMKDVCNLYLYPNQLRALRLSGALVAAWLERSAGQFRRIEPGAQDAPLIDPAFPSHHFDVMHGATYAIDLAAPPRFDPDGRLLDPAASRIRDLRVEGRPLAPEAEVIVVTNDYRAAGGGGFPGTGPGAAVLATAETNRAILAAYLAAAGLVDPAPEPVWRFLPMPGTTVTFDTAPAAEAHRAALGRPDITPLGPVEEGFFRYRLTL